MVAFFALLCLFKTACLTRNLAGLHSDQRLGGGLIRIVPCVRITCVRFSLHPLCITGGARSWS